MGKIIDITGQKYGRLTVIKYLGKDKFRNAKWECTCDCGAKVVVAGYCMRNGVTQSCGCRQREAAKAYNTKHGQAKTSTYHIWFDMKRRCLDPTRKGYENYGGRGIVVCDRWMSFKNFYTDMGDRPDSLELERVNNSEGYNPTNCVWATHTQQSRNKRTNKLNANQVRMIKYMLSVGISRKQVGDTHNVSSALIGNIDRGKAWVDIKI